MKNMISSFEKGIGFFGIDGFVKNQIA